MDTFKNPLSTSDKKEEIGVRVRVLWCHFCFRKVSLGQHKTAPSKDTYIE